MGYKSIPIPCTDHWVAPDASNWFNQCNADTLGDWVRENPLVWACLIPATIGLFFLFPTCGVILCSRYCCNCCGSAKMRPSSVCGCGGFAEKDDSRPQSALFRMYSRHGVLAVKICAGLLALVGVVAIALTAVGGVTMQRTVDDVLPTYDGIAAWANGVIAEAKSGIVDDDGNYPAGFEPEEFDAISRRIASYRTDVASFLNDHGDLIRMVTSIVTYTAILPGLVMMLPFFSAVANVRKCLPLTTAILSFFFQFLYLFVGSAYMVIYLAASIAYYDITTPLLPNVAAIHSSSSSSASMPPRLSDGSSVAADDFSLSLSKKVNGRFHSVLEWVVLPTCEKEAPFEEMQRNVAEMERDAAVEGCQRLLEFCSDTPNYDAINHPNVIFYCDLRTPQTQCTTVDAITAIIDGMHVKDWVPPSAVCAAGNSTIRPEECTVELCAKYCGNTEAREASTKAVKELTTGQRIMRTYKSTILPWLDCRRLITKVINTGIGSTGSTMRNAAGLLRDGALMIGLGSIAAVIISFLGQKRFFDAKLAGRGGAESFDSSSYAYLNHDAIEEGGGGIERDSGWWNAGSGVAAAQSAQATDKLGGRSNGVPSYAPPMRD